jgi:hypothetical protein
MIPKIAQLRQALVLLANIILDWEGFSATNALAYFGYFVRDGKKVLRHSLQVDSHGIINPSAFYNYLSAWYTNDAMAYSYSQATLVPTPKEWLHDHRDADLKIPKSQPIVLARCQYQTHFVADSVDK